MPGVKAERCIFQTWKVSDLILKMTIIPGE